MLCPGITEWVFMRKKVFFSPLVAIGLLVAAVFIVLQFLPIPWQKRDYSNELTDAVFTRLPPQEAGQLYWMLKTLDKGFEEHKITYWLDGVTLLGAVRHKGLIPWEKAGEIQVPQEDLEKVLSLKTELENAGLEMRQENGSLRVFSQHNPTVSIEISFASKDPVSGKLLHKKNGCASWDERDLFPLARSEFGPLELNIPKNPAHYLTELYGKDVMKKAWNPKDATSGQPFPKTQVEIVDFGSAPYEVPLELEESHLF
jgi:hypothetical protein